MRWVVAGLDIFKFAEKLMTMDDDTWARHANPLSVWSRFTCLPLLVVAIWSRVWLGWYAVVPILLTLLWIWWNPRAFAPVSTTDKWAIKVTYGERLFLKRHELNLPQHHLTAATILTSISVVGVVPLAYGLVVLNLWATLLGLTLMILGKTWFCDRMVWLYEDVEQS